MRGLVVMRVALILLAFAGTTAAAPTDEECMTCHGDPDLSQDLGGGSIRSLYTNYDIFSKSLHGPLGCTSCHADIEELPHQSDLKPVDCGQCHEEAQVYADSLHGKALAGGDKDVGGCQDCHGKHDIRAVTDPLSMTHKRNLAETCGRCHSDLSLVKRHMVSISKPTEAYLLGVHAQAILAGNENAAVCTDCHGVHEILPSQDPNSPIARLKIHATCGKCHELEMKEFEKSIHGKALLAGIKDSPTCTDCHGEHDIEPPEKDTSPVGRELVSKSTCPRCHDDTRIMTRYGVETMRQASYMDSYHGLASAAGSTVVASCTSCHGVHEILPHSDPASTTHKDNLPQTCGKCHPGADEKYASSPVHIMPTDPRQKALGIVRIAYLWLIALLLGGMFVHNTLLMARHMFGKLAEELHGRNTHKRFSAGQVIGHLVLTISFTLLAISGFALRYPDNYWLRLMFFNDPSSDVRGLMHRWAGVVLIALIVFHFLHATLTKSGRKELRALLPAWKDFKDLFLNIRYMFGLTKERPRYGRYGYSEKLEYWGMMWGSVLMGITGLCMWFAEAFLRYFHKIILDIVALIHFYEAWLAVGTIIIWHMYYVVLEPETYPMNWSWITGRITEEDFRVRHPLEYEEELKHRGGSENEDQPASNPIMASALEDRSDKP